MPSIMFISRKYTLLIQNNFSKNWTNDMKQTASRCHRLYQNHEMTSPYTQVSLILQVGHAIHLYYHMDENNYETESKP